MLSTPVDFYVGVVDLFTVLLPGALMSFLFIEPARKYILGPVLPAPQGDVASAIAFIAAAYVLGHFVFALGSYLDPLYDHTYLRWKRPVNKQDAQAKDEQKQDFLYAWAKDAVKNTIRGAVPESLRDHKDVVAESVGDHQDITKPIGVLKWATAFVRLQNASAAREIDRLEADSKFFRGFVVVLAFGCIIFLVGRLWLPAIICVPLACLSFLLFATRRWKRTELTYLYFIQLSTTPARVAEAVGALPQSN